MQIELLKELVRTIAGKGTEPIVDILNPQKPVNEFKIAEKLKLTINQTRNILYKLSNQNIVSFTRKKDEKKGWYIYFWMLNIGKALERLVAFKKKELYDIEHQVSSKENKHFYVCTVDNVEFNEETAIHHDFVCPECGQLLQLATFDKKVAELNVHIEKIKSEIKQVEEELAKIKAEMEKQMEKERLNKLKERQIARKAKAKKKKRANAKLKPKKAKVKKKKAKVKKKVKTKKKKVKAKKKVEKKIKSRKNLFKKKIQSKSKK